MVDNRSRARKTLISNTYTVKVARDVPLGVRRLPRRSTLQIPHVDIKSLYLSPYVARQFSYHLIISIRFVYKISCKIFGIKRTLFYNRIRRKSQYRHGIMQLELIQCWAITRVKINNGFDRIIYLFDELT